MALSPDELAQIRDVVRLELRQNTSTSSGKIVAWIILGFVCLFSAVLLLHVLVIGGFTVWHLLHPSP
jgi:cell division septal protein FtsQ